MGPRQPQQLQVRRVTGVGEEVVVGRLETESDREGGTLRWSTESPPCLLHISHS